MSLYIDLTEFIEHPITTGIQRIIGEICRYLPIHTAVPLRFQSGRYFALSPALIQVIGNYFGGHRESGIAEIRRLSAVDAASIVKVSAHDTVLVPEVFFDSQRLAFFRQMPESELRHHKFIVCDLLPLTHPEYFPQDGLTQMYGYFQLIRRANHCAFISEYTRETYFRRLKRTNTLSGTVLRLGSDGIGARPHSLRLNRPLNFAVLGTIEPRKNHALILEAFDPLLRQVEGLSLSFMGKLGWVDPDLSHKIRKLASEKGSGFTFCETPGDGEIRSSVEQSRATIYVSAAEGFGLPPVESLWLGTPVIASNTIPSLENVGSAGVHYVEPLDVVNLRRAVLSFVDDDYANNKARQAMKLNLPTWQSFTEEVLNWCTSQ